MTVRDKVEQQSPDGNVLFLEDLRKCLGMGVDTDDTLHSKEAEKGPLKVILMGHDMRGDFPNMEKAGIEISQHLHYAGCGDTHIWVEDTGRPLPTGLSGLIDHYGLAQCHYTKPLRNGQKWVFIGAHNAGNDAVMTIKLALAQAFDRGLVSGGGKALDLEDPEWLSKPLQGMDAGMILLAYDTESATNNNYATTVLNRTTEHGFAWLRFADVVGIAPGLNGVNWYPHIQARHWINKDLKSYKNHDYCVGNPHGFWEQYGKSRYYTDKEGPAPFQALFKELSSHRVVEKAAAAPEKLVLEPLAFPTLSDAMPTAQMKVPINVSLPAQRNNNTNVKRSLAGNHWARGPRGGSARGVPVGFISGGAGGGRTRVSISNGGPVENSNTTSDSRATITASTAIPTKSTTAASGNRNTTSGTTVTAKVTTSWAQIARGK